MISEIEKQELENIYDSLLNDERVKRMQKYEIHRGSNCYIHSFRVAKTAIRRSLKKKNIDLKVLLYACVLHDYYLYSRKHDEGRKKGHARKHPYVAIENARKDFNISNEVAEAIECHMWPFNFKKYPKTKEAKMLCHIDNVIAFKEFLQCKKYKHKNKDRYNQIIAKLF